MKKFTVRRSKWLRGEDAGSLLNDAGKMCCLGFAVNQICRVPKKKLLNYCTPSSVLGSEKETPFTLVGGVDRHFIKQAVEINDCSLTPDKVREESLTKLFKENGIKVTFKD